MRKCIAVVLLPIAVSLFAKPYQKILNSEMRIQNYFAQPVKKPLPVKECADYTTIDGIPAGCQIYWFGALVGDTIGCTQYDRQWNMSPQKRIIFDPKTGCTHALWMHQLRGAERHMYYNCKIGEIWAQGQELHGGTPVQEASRDGYGDLDVDTAGLAVVGLHRMIGTNVQSAVYIDQVSPGMGSFKKLKDLPNAPGDNQTIWPMVAVNSKNHIVITAHADSTIGQPGEYDKLWYTYSKDGGTIWSDWAVVDTFPGLEYNVFASKKSEKICIPWNKDFQEAGLWNGHMMYMESNDGGATWGDKRDAFNRCIETPTNKAYDFLTMKHSVGNVYGIYDSDDNVHLVTDASIGTSSKGSYYPALSCVIWHYSESKGMHIVAAQPAPYKLAWSSPDWNLLYPYSGQVMAKPVISEDPTNKYLYVAWVEFPYDTTHPAGYQAGEIYITYSMDGGETWAPKLNLTMTPAECEVFATITPATNDTVRIFYEYDNSGHDGVAYTPAGQPPELDTTNPMMYLEVPVTRGDVEIVDITSPEIDTVIDGMEFIIPDSGATYSPKALYKNNGTTPVSFQTRFEILAYTYYLLGDTLNPDTLFTPILMYYDIKNVEGLAPSETTTVDFKQWTSELGLPSQTLLFALRAYATFLVDTNLLNNGGDPSSGPGIAENIATPQPFTLSQPYPNPARTTVNIRYSVPQTSFVSLKVYDITGKLVSTLVDKTCKAGTYITNWNGKTDNGKSVPNGIYFYRLSTGSYSATKKIVLLK